MKVKHWTDPIRGPRVITGRAVVPTPRLVDYAWQFVGIVVIVTVMLFIGWRLSEWLP